MRLCAVLKYLEATFLEFVYLWGYVPREKFNLRLVFLSYHLGLRPSSLFISEATFLGSNSFSCFVPLLFSRRLHSYVVYLRGYVPRKYFLCKVLFLFSIIENTNKTVIFLRSPHSLLWSLPDISFPFRCILDVHNGPNTLLHKHLKPLSQHQPGDQEGLHL